MLDKVQNYDPSHPTLKTSFRTLQWSSLFLYDLAFGFSTRQKNERGQMLKKFQNNTRIGKRFESIHNATVEKLIRDRKDSVYSEALPVPSISPEHFTAKGFRSWKSEINTPLVVKNFLKDAPILELASKEKLIENHGDIPVRCVQPDFHLKAKEESGIGQNVDPAHTTLKEFLTSEEFDSFYINFLPLLDKEDFLNSCKGRELDDLLGQPNIMNQWFISRVANNGSTLHNASADNMFLNIKGLKEWYFIHPSYTPLMQSSMSKHGLYCVSETDETFEEDYYQFMVKKYPYFKHIPVYRVVLEEGDLLFNPPWWWHRVQNLTPFTVGCATRYYEVKKAITNVPTFFLGILIETIKDPKNSPDYLAKKTMKDRKYALRLHDIAFTKKENSSAKN